SCEASSAPSASRTMLGLPRKVRVRSGWNFTSLQCMGTNSPIASKSEMAKRSGLARANGARHPFADARHDAGNSGQRAAVIGGQHRVGHAARRQNVEPGGAQVRLGADRVLQVKRRVDGADGCLNLGGEGRLVGIVGAQPREYVR